MVVSVQKASLCTEANAKKAARLNLVVSTSVRAPNLLKKSEKIGSLSFFYIVSFEQIKIIKINKQNLDYPQIR
ncbi:MAG: hypothetical protein DRR16_16715 [Candidatus Parabeggiatoa sp. nov. 3]|nr:MAG: hypothetical protein DRR00_21395 [Gammaproteobacteria bacterium]RKZ56064.1 MAG: hypothetical protein DRQ99_29130 [Gammaproteobacteria bacterium]RKZ83668.1 MAG: hypothetical protein DRR16_16715 [Gammaproteobacteria bacterium]